ncbi:MAG: HAD family hydrolase [Bacteroidota bacterium]
MNLRTTDSLIFDLDGTLWDASESCAKAWNDLLTELGITEYTIDGPAIRAVSGLSIDKVFKEHFTFIPENMRASLLEAYKPKESEYMKRFGGKLYPNVKEVLKELSVHYKLFVVSNCLSGYIENFIEFNTLEGIFSDHECSGRTGQAKSENIKSIVERNKLTSPVYIGDTIWDYDAATAAGVPFIFAAYGFGKVDNAECEVNEFEGIKSLFRPVSTSAY